MVEIEKNYYELPLPDVVQGMATDATPQPNNPATPTSGSNIVSSANGSVLAGGAFQSPNFVTGSSGWIIRTDGSVEFGTGKFRGDITGASGTFSGTLSAILGNIANWVISSLALYFDGATDAQSSGMAPADYPFYAGKKYASRATAPFKVEPSGKLTVTDIVATGTINAQGGYLANGVYIGASDALLVEATGLNVGVTGHIRGGATDYATGVGFFLGYSGGAYKFSVGDPAGKYINWTGSDFVVNGFVVSSKGAFGGDGSDGALAITSGTTTIDVGAASVYIKNYSSISITGTTGKLAFSNPASGGTAIIIKSQGAVVLTSTVTVSGTLGCIDISGMGSAGGAGGSSDNGSAGTGRNFVFLLTDGGDGGLGNGNDATQTPGGAAIAFSYNDTVLSAPKYSLLYVGAGGGGGGSQAATGGAGGRGAGCLVIECAGDLNFPNTVGIYAKGTVGVDGTGASAAGGGGGGGGGNVQVFYNSATASNGVITVTAGAGGGYVVGQHARGGGGGGSRSVGSNGISGGSGNTSPGGAGGAGYSLVTQNTEQT